MPLREDLLTPIAGENPSGADLRYDSKLLIYDKIKEARRQDDGLAQGDWQHDRKIADYVAVSKTAQEALATKSKDLQLAAWLTEALLHQDRFAGLRQGLELCRGLVNDFWDSLYPPIEDGDAELRAAPLEWIGTVLEIPLKSVPLTRSGYDWFKFKESRLVGYEEHAQSEKEKALREQRLAEGKLAPEVFDKAFVETPKVFYSQAEKDLDSCLQTLTGLNELCDEKFGDAAPSLTKLKAALEAVRHDVHALLEKKRETEPDPVEEVQGDAAMAKDGAEPGNGAAHPSMPSIVISIMTSSEPADRKEAIANVAKTAAFLRKREPHSPAPYLMMRGLRWGELRAAAELRDATLLEAPPMELRQLIKRLALANKWDELLETGENAMSLPCSRGWLDLQRFVVEACTALGTEYEPIAAAIRSELKTLIQDLPQIVHATLLDDTPAANAETAAWLKQLAGEPVPEAGKTEGENGAPVNGSEAPSASWPAKLTDSYAAARHALQAGQPEKAFEIMQTEIARQKSGRGKFARKLQLVQLCVAAGKDTIAQPFLEDLAAAIEAHRLEDWEDKELIAEALSTIMKVSKRVQDDSSEKQRLFERICRLDPVRALNSE